MSDTITLHVQWIEDGNNITSDPCAEQNADSVRLWTPDGECVAEWTRNGEPGALLTRWDVTASDYGPDVLDNGDLSGFARPGDAVNAGVEWFRTTCQPTCTVELD